MATLYYFNGLQIGNPVQNVVWSGNTLEIEHHGGNIGMYNHDVGIISDNDGSLLYILSYAGNLTETDTDGDGLSDRLEQFGFPDGMGNVYYTDYQNPDTDYDGLTDGEEAGDFKVDGWQRYYQIKSSPSNPDTDDDGVYDPDEDELANSDTGITCSPLIPDSDKDGLTEGQELYLYGTDPANPDTDGDGWDDGKEISNWYDPLTVETVHFTHLQRIAEGLVGFIAGEFLADGHDTAEYFVGWMLSGFIEVGDVRDVLGSLFHMDPIGAAINAVGLIPLGGDAGKVIEKGVRFIEQFPHMKPVVSVFCHSLVPGITTTRLVQGDEMVESLLKKGFTQEAIVFYEKMFGKLERLDKALESSQLYERYPKIREFIMDACKNDPTFMSGRFTWNIKNMVARYEKGRSITGFIGNVQGSYTERLLSRFIHGLDGVQEIEVIKDITHVNHAGVETVVYMKRKINEQTKKILYIGESKARKELSLSDLKNYIRKAPNDDVVRFQPTYLNKAICEEFFTDPSIEKRFIIYINSPESANLLTTIKDKYPYKYWSKEKKQNFVGEVIIEKVTENV